MIGTRVGIPLMRGGYVCAGVIISEKMLHGQTVYLVKSERTGREAWKPRGYFEVIREDRR